jgi:hypothetical protein
METHTRLLRSKQRTTKTRGHKKPHNAAQTLVARQIPREHRSEIKQAIISFIDFFLVSLFLNNSVSTELVCGLLGNYVAVKGVTKIGARAGLLYEMDLELIN